MKSYVIDVDCLITLVQDKPVVWDKAMALYKDRNATKKAWKDICTRLFTGYEELGDNEKYNFTKTVMKKWTNVRDAFQKSRRRHKESGPSAFKNKAYVYESQLQFLLRDCANHNEDSLSSEVNSAIAVNERSVETPPENPPTEDETVGTVVRPRRHRKRKPETLDPVELKVMDFVNRKPDRHLSFFKGIIPSLSKFDDDDVIEFQMAVLNIIKTIKRRKKSSSATHDGAEEAINILPMYLRSQ